MELMRLAVFPTDERGRAMLADFQNRMVVVNFKPGYMVNNGKQEPCLWVGYVTPITDEQPMEESDVSATEGVKAPISKKSKSC